jgi:hypothetical protein
VSAVDGLSKEWWSFNLPGYREVEHGTYRAITDPPPIERELDDEVEWLRREPRVARSLEDIDTDRHPAPRRRASAKELRNLIGNSDLRLPASFITFISEPDLHGRIRSCTYSYLDLGDFPVTSDGGMFIHFLSDQQWISHWSLYAGVRGTEAVIVSEQPLGFRDDDRVHDRLDLTFGRAAVCADSFSEFLYRYWIENEIFFRVADEAGVEPPLTQEQQRYAEFFRR